MIWNLTTSTRWKKILCISFKQKNIKSCQFFNIARRSSYCSDKWQHYEKKRENKMKRYVWSGTVSEIVLRVPLSALLKWTEVVFHGLLNVWHLIVLCSIDASAGPYKNSQNRWGPQLCHHVPSQKALEEGRTKYTSTLNEEERWTYWFLNQYITDLRKCQPVGHQPELHSPPYAECLQAGL